MLRRRLPARVFARTKDNAPLSQRHHGKWNPLSHISHNTHSVTITDRRGASGDIGKIANGVVSVNAYGVLDHITFALIFHVYKPRTGLQSEDVYKTRPALAVETTLELEQWRLHFDDLLDEGERSKDHRPR